MSNKFLYEVRPVKPVVTPDGRAKRRPFSSLLNKEEVMEYMNYLLVVALMHLTQIILSMK